MGTGETSGMCSCDSSSLSDRRDDMLLEDYRALGGVMCADDLVLIARVLMPQPLSWVARSIVDRSILTFTWRSRVFVPRFQFGAHPLQVTSQVSGAMGELEAVYADNLLASWFVEPNCWLGQRRPCTEVSQRPELVLAAARGDRRLVSGW
jgi:hypothetical protein